MSQDCVCPLCYSMLFCCVISTRPIRLRFSVPATAAGRQTVDRECAWKHSPIVESMNSEGNPGRGARYFEAKQPLADVTWSSKQGAGLTGMLTSTRRPKWTKVCLDECVYMLLRSKFVQIKEMNIYQANQAIG
ncbi:hypothetical protein CDAR_297861 [Caerostris darwini]|uniref:Uncharacterized protein n=1 Tax=Caerostris darwini TaxID=1538125 RepID=A0AAV4U7Y6_9ARAC|nr:hypothetical protein CDAR_297861 [Caerostris darwini]